MRRACFCVVSVMCGEQDHQYPFPAKFISPTWLSHQHGVIPTCSATTFFLSNLGLFHPAACLYLSGLRL